MFGQKNNLADVLGVVGDLPVDRLQHGVRLAADRHRAHNVLRLKAADCGEYTFPTIVPPLHHLGASGGAGERKFLVAEAVRLLPVAGEKVCEAGAHISGEVLHQDCNRVCFRIKRDKKILVLKLRHCPFAKTFITAHLAASLIEIVCCEIRHRGPSSSAYATLGARSQDFGAQTPQPPSFFEIMSSAINVSW